MPDRFKKYRYESLARLRAMKYGDPERDSRHYLDK